MSRNDVNITININGDTHTLRAAREDVNALGRSLSNTDTIANALRGSFGKIAASVASIGALAVGVKELAASGIEANRSFENLKIQLTGLIAANSSNVSMMGKTLDAHAKWNMGMRESEGILKKLNETNAKTKFTLEEITGAFNMFYATSAGQGSREKAVQAMDSIALAAQAVGKNLGDLTPMMDSLATGTVIAASEMGSFMKIVGLTNEELKKASSEGKVYDHIIEKLAKYKELSAEAAKGYEVALGSLKNELTELSRELTKPMFDTLTAGIAAFSNFIKENKATIIEWARYITEAAKHLAALGAAFVGAKLLSLGASKAFEAFRAALPLLTAEIKLTAAAAGLLNTALTGIKTAFKTFLPTAVVFGAFELLMNYTDKSKEKMSELGDTIEKTAEDFKKLTQNERDYEELKIVKQINAANLELIKLQKELQKAQTVYNVVFKGSGVGEEGEIVSWVDESLKNDKTVRLKAQMDELVRTIENLTGAQRELKTASLQAAGGMDALAQSTDEASKSMSKAKEKFGKTLILKDLTDDLEDAKRILDDLKKEDGDETLIRRGEKYIKDLETKIKNFSKSTNAAVSNVAALKSALKEIAEINFTDMEKKTQRVLDRYNEMLSLGVGKQKAREYLESSLAKIANEHLAEFEKSEKEALERQLALRSEYYTAIGDMQNAWLIKKAELEKKYQNLTFEDGKKITKEQLDKLLKMEEKAFLQGSKIAKNSFKDIKNSWADTVSSMSKTVEDGFFNYFIGKTKSLKTALKDIGTNLMRDMISPYARALSQGISGGFGAMLGGGSNLASIASNLGLAKNDSGGWSGSVGGTPVELSSTGEILRGANALDKSTTNLLGSISNLQSAYQTLTGGYRGLVSKFTTVPTGYLSEYLSSMGWTNGYFGLQGLGAGAQHALTGSILNGGGLNGALSGAYSGGYMAGAGLAGAGLGYGIGYLGDRLFKANTHASSVGAVGGALGGAASAGAFGAKIGSSVGPWGAVIGAVAGALIGGAFGKKKATGSGISVLEDINAGDTLSNKNIRSYIDMQKKGWFSKKSWSELSDLDDASMREIGAQLNTMNRLASRAGALATLKLSQGKYSGESLANEGFAKAILRSMTGQAEQTWAEVTESGGKKRKGLLGKIGGVFEKVMKFSPSSIINRITKPLDDVITKSMNKAGLGAIDNMARGMRDEFGRASDGNIFGLKSSRKIDDLLNLSRDETNKNQKLVDNPEFSRMWKDWEEQAKKANKKAIELMSQSLGAIADTYKSLELLTTKNPVKQVETSMRQAFESFTDAAQALKLDIPKQMGSIADLSVEQMALAYRKAIASDFTKSNIDSLNSLVKAYEAARKAQDDYTKAVLSFTQQIAQTQAGFYSAHGIDNSFLNYQNIYTKFRTLIGALDKDIGDGHKQGVLKNGSLGDINSWAKHFLSMSSSSLGEFLSNGNVELRKALIETLTQYKSQANSTGGHEHWTKSMADLETVNKQIAALKLAQEAKKNIELQKEQAQKQLDALKEQLSILNLQKGAVEKIGSIAKSIRDSVIDRTTSTINYRSALEQAKKAFASGDYGSKAFGNLSDAVSHQKRFYEDTAATYEDYRLAMLRMAGEVEAITNHVTLDTIDKSIKELEDRIKKAQKELVEKNETLNQTGQDQLSMLEQQRQALIESSQKQLERMSDLLGAGSPIVRYLKDMLEYLIKPETGKDGKPKPPGIPNYTTPDNIHTGVNTANGAVVKSELDKFINNTYLSVLGRSVEQSGLDYWRDQIEKGKTSKQDLAGALAASARAMTGSNDRTDWIEWAKSKGYKPFADGGIVTRPTRALIGEAGYDEAVIPLDGRKLKIDAGDDFRALSKKTDTLEQTMSEVKDAVKELVRYVRGIITEDGQGIYAKEKK